MIRPAGTRLRREPDFGFNNLPTGRRVLFIEASAGVPNRHHFCELWPPVRKESKLYESPICARSSGFVISSVRFE